MSDINRYFNIDKIPDKEVPIKDTEWKRFDSWAENGVIYWARPLYHDQRDWNRHSVDIKGESKFPTYTIELNYLKENEFGVSISRTQGPDEDSPGMGGVIDGTTVSDLETAVTKIESYMNEYSN